MMELPRITIKEIEEKEFNIVRTDGYDPQEVDEYLDRIMDEMARQIDEIAMLRQELQAAKARPAVQAPVQPVQPVQPVRQQSGGAGQALEILEMAQRVKEETIAKAQKEAEEMVAEAKVRAEEQLGNLGEKKEQLTAEVERLKTLATEYRAHFEALLQAQKEALDKAADLF